MFKTLKAALAAVLLAFSPLHAAARTAPSVTVAHPLLWEISDGKAHIYLFGSIHVMKPGTVWLSADLQKRFNSADQVWFEVANLDDQAAIMRETQKYIVDPTGHMTEGLTPEEVQKLDALLRRYGLSSVQLMSVRKWVVALTVSVRQMTEAGYDPQAGVDLTLLKQARAAGKPVHGFETIGQEMEKLTPATPAEDIASLRSVINDSDDAQKDIAGLFDAWATGDAPRLSRYLVDKMQVEEPSMYRRVIVERDAAWTPEVEQLLKNLKAQGGGTAFLTVGVAHLVGPDSLIAMLKKNGVKVTQVH